MKERIFVLFIILSVLSGGSRPVAPNAKTGAQETQTDRPPMFVLQVGIGKYKNGAKWVELRGSRTDVEEMKKLLTAERYAVPENNIRTLFDEQATKRQIFDEFENHLVAKARDYFNQTKRRDAVALFQFSGHGSQAPDRNGDEEDGRDETLVTFDSEDAEGKNFDITDDEIFALTKRLNQYTDNIVYILDSCHSGSGTRDGGDARQMPPRKSVPVPMLKSQARGDEQKEKDSEQTDLMPPGDDYIVISAARARQTALQKYVFADEKSALPAAVYGYLTFYLIEALRNAKPSTSYDELMDEVKRKVESEKPTQTPVLEGDGRRYVFGGLSRKKDAGIKILVAEKKKISVQAGAMQGISLGTILDLYNADEEKIGTARVVKVDADKSDAEIVAAQKEITTNDRAIFVAPDFGSLRLKVLLDGEDPAKLSAADKKMIQNLREFFAPAREEYKSKEVDLVAGKWNDQTARWDAALLKDSFGRVFPDSTRAAPVKIGKDKNGSVYEKFPPASRQVFYLAGPDFAPLYGFYVEAEKDYTEDAIRKALLHLSRLRSVIAIANNKSKLKGTIKMTPVRLINPSCEDGRIIAEKKQPAVLNAAGKAYKFGLGEIFWLEITNTSKADLYLLALNIGSNGSVEILAPQKVEEFQDTGLKLSPGEKRIIPGEYCRDGVRKTTAPSGVDIFKVIASPAPIKYRDFAFLEMEGMNEREKGVKSMTGFNDWTTAEIYLEITAMQTW